MRFRFHPVFLLSLGLFSLQCHAAESLLPASAVSAASPVSAPVVATPDAEQPVEIDADRMEGKKGEPMEAHGNVELQQGKQKVFADHLFYEPSTADLSANGAVRLEQPSGKVSGPDLKLNLHSNVGEMNTPVFQFADNNARGSAETMHSSDKLHYEFDGATYTTCPAGNDDWLLHMSTLEIDRHEQLGTAYNAWVEFKGVPILYTPWMDFPLDGRRRSGLLAPTYGNTASSGGELTVPLYLNLAPNYDATIAPRVMDKRGTLLNNEFRYMGGSYVGELHYDVLQNDRIANYSRSHTTLKHSQNLGGGFGAVVNLNRVSDDAYFRDLSTTVAAATQTQLLNEGVLSYGGGWWATSVRAQTYQTLQNATSSVASPYQRLPQISLTAQKSSREGSVNLVSEYVDFRHASLVNGKRTVVYPSVTYALVSDPGYYIKPKLGVHSTQYVLGDNNAANTPDTTRTLPIFSLDSGMTFERDLTLGEGEYLQTLEPRAYYVKIPYQNQSFLPLFDTTLAPFTFAQMFTENRFIGNDRIGDANMATFALTSRLIDNEGGVERMRVAVGERFSYEAPRENLGTPAANSRSDILVAAGGRVTNALTLDGLLQYNPDAARTLSYNGTARYKPETGKVLNLGYRYTYVDGSTLNDVRQGDISAQWPLFGRWNLVTRWVYLLNESRFTEQLAGLEYNQACWMLRLVAQKFPVANQHTSTGIFIQLELNDLVAMGNDPLSALRTSIPGYTKLNATPAKKP
jgi:LPS-assembly protein